MDLDSIMVHKHTQKEQSQYPAILTKQAWPIKGKEHCFSQDTAGNPKRAR